jgi:hypothetical protein
MTLWPTQRDEKRFGPATALYETVALSFVIPPAPACRGTGAKRSGGICSFPRNQRSFTTRKTKTQTKAKEIL